MKNPERTEHRTARNHFLEFLMPYRRDLYRFCRSLTKNPFDAEDLVQETILRVYGRFSDIHQGIANPRSYLFKTASNLWIDQARRAARLLPSEQSESYPEYDARLDASNTIGFLFEKLPPKERVAYVLAEVFEFSLEEIADLTQSTLASVKMALSRSRGKIQPSNDAEIKPSVSFKSQNNSLIDAAVMAFNKRDLNQMASLFMTSAVAVGTGCFVENGINEIKKGSLFYTVNDFAGAPQPASFSARRVEIFGGSYFAIFNGDVLDDVWRFDCEEEQFSAYTCYYCSPDLLNDVAAVLGVKANHHGYYFDPNQKPT